MNNRKVLTQEKFNILAALIGVIIFASSIISMISNSFGVRDTFSLVITSIGIVIAAVTFLLHKEKNDERSRENYARAGNVTSLIIQILLTLLLAGGIIFDKYSALIINVNSILMLLGILIFTKAIAFIKYERTGE